MNVIFPFQGRDAVLDLPPVRALNSTTRLFAVPTPFALTYSCSQRILKGWLSLLISVLAADIALIIGAYNLFIFVVGYVQKRRIKAGSMCVSGTVLILRKFHQSSRRMRAKVELGQLDRVNTYKLPMYVVVLKNIKTRISLASPP